MKAVSGKIVSVAFLVKARPGCQISFEQLVMEQKKATALLCCCKYSPHPSTSTERRKTKREEKRAIIADKGDGTNVNDS